MAVFDYTDPCADDAEEVYRIASMLQISEFQLFHVAYFHWFGTKITDKEMESFFVEYMFRSIIPYWVRNMLRTMGKRIEDGQGLDPAEFNIDPPRVNPETKAKGLRYTALVSALFILYCILLTHTPSS